MTTYISQADLKKLLAYDAETGVFTWIVKPSWGVNVGGRAGYTADSGYRSIAIDGTAYKEHRLAWLYVTGEIPEFDIDHINGARDDNRFLNLRLASRLENMQNVSVSKANSTGFVGTCFITAKQKWAAYITVTRRRIHLGHFDSLDDAVNARRAAKQKYHSFQNFDRGIAA